MGAYYTGISKRNLKVEGFKIAFSNFYGKAPIWGTNEHRWNSFVTRSENTGRVVLNEGDVNYVVRAKDINEIKRYGYADLYKWAGKGVMSDAYWDNNLVGIVYFKDKKLSLAFGIEAKKIRRLCESKLI